MARNVRREIRQNQEAGVVIEEITDFKPFDNEFARLFGQTYRHHSGQECPLTAKFFLEVSSQCSGTAAAYCAFKKGQLQGFSLVLKGEDIWHVFLTGQEYTENESDNSFFNMVFYSPIREAIAQGVKRIHFGPANYETKRRRGCRTEPFFMWLRSPKKHINLALPIWMKVTDYWYQRKYHDIFTKE